MLPQDETEDHSNHLSEFANPAIGQLSVDAINSKPEVVTSLLQFHDSSKHPIVHCPSELISSLIYLI